MAELRLEFWKQQTDKKFSSLRVEGYYEIIKECIYAHMYANGYTCKNHICLIAYIQQYISNFEYEAQKIDELRKIRNNIAYRGVHVPNKYLQTNRLEIEHIIKKIIESIPKA